MVRFSRHGFALLLILLFLPLKILVVFIFTSLRDVGAAIGTEISQARAGADKDHWNR